MFSISPLLPSQGCVKSFTTFPGLRYHLLHHNSSSKPLPVTCPKCGKRLLGEKKLQIHIYKKHQDSSKSAILEVTQQYCVSNVIVFINRPSLR